MGCKLAAGLVQAVLVCAYGLSRVQNKTKATGLQNGSQRRRWGSILGEKDIRGGGRVLKNFGISYSGGGARNTQT